MNIKDLSKGNDDNYAFDFTKESKKENWIKRLFKLSKKSNEKTIKVPFFPFLENGKAEGSISFKTNVSLIRLAEILQGKRKGLFQTKGDIHRSIYACGLQVHLAALDDEIMENVEDADFIKALEKVMVAKQKIERFKMIQKSTKVYFEQYNMHLISFEELKKELEDLLNTQKGKAFDQLKKEIKIQLLRLKERMEMDFGI